MCTHVHVYMCIGVYAYTHKCVFPTLYITGILQDLVQGPVIYNVGIHI